MITTTDKKVVGKATGNWMKHVGGRSLPARTTALILIGLALFADISPFAYSMAGV
jgi:hypothetical protein